MRDRRLFAIAGVSLLLLGCASGPEPVVVVPGEPMAPGEAAAWAKACVYGPLKARIPAGARPISALSEGQRVALGDIEVLARRTYATDAAGRRGEVDRFSKRLRELTPARLQDYRKAAQWRADLIERRVPHKKRLRQQSPCYGLLLDVYHHAGSALDWKRREATRPVAVPAPTGVRVHATKMTPIDGGWTVTLDRGKLHGVEAGDWSKIVYEGQQAFLVVSRVQARQAVATVRPKLPLPALRVGFPLTAGPPPPKAR